MADFVGVEIDGIEELQAKLKQLPDAAKDEGADEAYKYLLNVMRQYPPQKRVTRKQAYGVTFFSDKQRRFFFRALANGEISVPYKRSQVMKRSWRKVGDGARAFLVNESDYAPFMYDDKKQSRMSRLIGWKTISQTIKEKTTEVVRRFDAGVKKAIKRLNL